MNAPKRKKPEEFEARNFREYIDSLAPEKITPIITTSRPFVYRDNLKDAGIQVIRGMSAIRYII